MIEDVFMPIAIVFIVFAAISFWVYLSHRSSEIKDASKGFNSSLAEENEALRMKTEDLEQRIQVLESIVTDSGFQLNQEFSRIS